MSAEGTAGAAKRVAHNMEFVEPSGEYETMVVDALSSERAVRSLVCNGAIPMELDDTKKEEVNPDHVGRGLVVSYVTNAYNAVVDAYPGDAKLIEHCLFRTHGELVLDFSDSKWPLDVAGAFMALTAHPELRRSLLDLTNHILRDSDDDEGRLAIRKAYLDTLLLPILQTPPSGGLSLDGMIYIYFAIREMTKNVLSSDVTAVQEALRAVTDIPTRREVVPSVLGIISVFLGMKIPEYVPVSGPVREYAEKVHCFGFEADRRRFELESLRCWLATIEPGPKQDLLGARFIDAYYEWGGYDESLDATRQSLENNNIGMNPVITYSLEHRAVTSQEIRGVKSITKPVPVRGGKLVPAEYGAELSTADLQPRLVGKIDSNRVSVTFATDETRLHYHTPRGVALNTLYFVRPAMFVKTEVRTEWLDSDTLVGQAAVYMLLRGGIPPIFARKILAAITHKYFTVKKNETSGFTNIVGNEDGKVVIEGWVSPHILGAFPVLVTNDNNLFIYHEDKTYPLSFVGRKWRVREATFLSDDKLTAFGNLSTGFPLEA